MVCWLYNIDHWQLCQGWYKYVDSGAGWTECEKSNLPQSGFVAFDQYKSLLADAEGNISGPKTVLAGFGAGITESLLAVTPTESIKTTLYALPFYQIGLCCLEQIG